MNTMALHIDGSAGYSIWYPIKKKLKLIDSGILNYSNVIFQESDLRALIIFHDIKKAIISSHKSKLSVALTKLCVSEIINNSFHIHPHHWKPGLGQKNSVNLGNWFHANIDNPAIKPVIVAPYKPSVYLKTRKD